MTELNITGGARVGMANATWPLASMNVTKDRLTLNAGFVGNLVFRTEDIISLKPYYIIPLLGQGIKINHSIPQYKEKVIFWTFKNPNRIIEQIKQTGFLDYTSTEQHNDKGIIVQRQQQRGFPVKTPFTIGVIVLWNILFLLDFLSITSSDSAGVHLGIGAASALGIVLLSCILILVSKDFRKIVLKEGRELKDVNKILYFLIFICSLLFLSVLAFPR
jgi:hypothetical protein